jgi:16S rRNA C967 or C1407 C5-methylase (RsmB/RsmF family)
MPRSSLFLEYYRELGVIPEDEWDTFVDVIHTPLPTAFRININCAYPTKLRQRLREEFGPKQFSEQFQRVAPYPFPWYPAEGGWQLGYDKKTLRQIALRPNHAELDKTEAATMAALGEKISALYAFLVSETATGHLSRQEAVSMLPPLALDVKAHHKVLDMCASPGSKTAQMLEVMIQESRKGDKGERGENAADGLVVANDLNVRRGNMLVHQLQRLDNQKVVVTTHDASNFPLPDQTAGGEPGDDRGCFDRVLCDVPCSGDGTMRKAPELLRRWHPGGALTLHPIQLAIALRAVELLKVGGLMVYSTCSLNPIEDESVVAALLQQCGGAVEVVDLCLGSTAESTPLAGLQAKEGVRDWKVGWSKAPPFNGGAAGKKRQELRRRQMTRTDGAAADGDLTPDVTPEQDAPEDEEKEDEVKLQWFTEWDQVPLKLRRRLPQTMFVPTDPTDGVAPPMAAPSSPSPAIEPLGAEEALSQLRHCIRILPHAQDTGGFFVALLRKVKPFVRKSDADLAGEADEAGEATRSRSCECTATPQVQLLLPQHYFQSQFLNSLCDKATHEAALANTVPDTAQAVSAKNDGSGSGMTNAEPPSCASGYYSPLPSSQCLQRRALEAHLQKHKIARAAKKEMKKAAKREERRKEKEAKTARVEKARLEREEKQRIKKEKKLQKQALKLAQQQGGQQGETVQLQVPQAVQSPSTAASAPSAVLDERAAAPVDIYMPVQEAQWRELCRYYGMDYADDSDDEGESAGGSEGLQQGKRCPPLPRSRIFVRAAGRSTERALGHDTSGTIWLVDRAVREFCMRPSSSSDSKGTPHYKLHGGMRIMHAGVRLFSRSAMAPAATGDDSSANYQFGLYRPAQEGLRLLLPHLHRSQQLVPLCLSDFVLMLRHAARESTKGKNKAKKRATNAEQDEENDGEDEDEEQEDQDQGDQFLSIDIFNAASRLRNLPLGPAVVVLDGRAARALSPKLFMTKPTDDEREESLQAAVNSCASTLAWSLSVWIGRNQLNVLASRITAQNMLTVMDGI